MTDRPPPDSLEIAEALSLLAHDLKNPLAAILTNLGFVRGYVDDLSPDEPPREEDLVDAREAMLDAKLACESLQRFVSNLEVIARDLGGGRASLPPEPLPLDLAALADELVSRHQSAATARRLTLEVVNNGRSWARGDRDGVLRAGDNIVANAVQHAPAGTKITVEIAEQAPRAVAMTVLDSGVVIPESLHEDALSRPGQSRAKGFPEARYGRGLSLYVAAAAARAGGARLTLGSRAGLSAIALVLPRFDDGA